MKYQNKLKELEAKQAAISIEIAELAKAMKDEPASAFPQKGDKCWVIEGDDVDYFWFDGDETDNGFIAVGNFFEFPEQALAELETRKVIAELKKCKGVKKFVNGEMNYVISYSLTERLFLGTWSEAPLGIFQVYFDASDNVKSAIEQVGKDRIIKAIKWLACGEY